MNTSKRYQIVIIRITSVNCNLARIRHQFHSGREPVDEQLGNRTLNPTAQPWTFRQDFPNLHQQSGTRYHPKGIVFQPCVNDPA